MKIHEYQGRALLKKAGIPVSEGDVAVTVEEALAIAAKAGYPVVLKAQVLTGGRGKAGGVKVVANEAQLKTEFVRIQALKIKDYSVEKIFVVRALDIKREFYSAVTVDPAQGDVVLIASSAGGVDIEETAKTQPEKIIKLYLEGQQTVDEGKWQKFLAAVFPDKADQAQASPILKGLIAAFFAYDCSLAEINPLVVDASGRWSAADAKIVFDDNGLFRHPEFSAMRDMAYEEKDELDAKEANLSFVKLDGNVGCIVNGAGLAMATMDVIKLMGGEPANFLDVGGSSNPQKVLSALKIILRNTQVKSILINIFGGITRCDDIASGIIQARGQMNLPVPMVVRLTGTNEEEAKAMLAAEGISTYSTMREVVQKAVELAK